MSLSNPTNGKVNSNAEATQASTDKMAKSKMYLYLSKMAKRKRKEMKSQEKK